MGRHFSREKEWFRGHASQRPPESGEEDGCGRAERGREADMEETDTIGEDVKEADAGDTGPNRKKPEPYTRATVRRGGETRLAQGAERHGESHPAGQPRHVPGGTWLNKLWLYFQKGRPLFKRSEERERTRGIRTPL
ncbi:hypothetical protein NDU88_001131 [Pleurodeles waltl]|uniref:Uncharacterized protein n=1 Tax=Pleurodeles waltl TaxID=8319 RepID=A0AAV7UTX2_PLEWA|nr:hypothetical protein NDU88_001131 [Pleurodeles waltl]